MEATGYGRVYSPYATSRLDEPAGSRTGTLIRSTHERSVIGGWPEVRHTRAPAKRAVRASEAQRDQYYEIFKKNLNSTQRYDTKCSGAALSLLKEMRGRHITPSRASFLVALNTCEREKNLIAAEQVFVEMRKNKITPTTKHYNKLIGMYAKQTRPGKEAAERVLELMKSLEDHGGTPDSYTLCFVLKILGRSGRANEVKGHFDQFVKKYGRIVNQPCYATAISACASEGKCEEARALFDGMIAASEKDRDLLPHLNTINAMVGAYGNAGRRKDAEAFVEEWTEKRPHGMRVAPNAATLAVLVRACSWKATSAKDEGELRRLSSETTEDEIDPIDKSSPHVERVFKRGWVQEAEVSMRKMMKAHRIASAFAYSHLICDYMDHADEPSAFRLIEEACGAGIFKEEILSDKVLDKVDFHQRAIFREDDSNRRGISDNACVPPLLAIAIFQYHRHKKHVHDQTRCIVGQHGKNVLKFAMLEYLNREHNPKVYGVSAANPGVICRIDDGGRHTWS